MNGHPQWVPYGQEVDSSLRKIGLFGRASRREARVGSWKSGVRVNIHIHTVPVQMERLRGVTKFASGAL